MFKKMKLYKKILLLSIAIGVLFVYLYEEMRPAVVIHTPAGSSYFICKELWADGDIFSLPFFQRKMVPNRDGDRINYPLPYTWNWNEEKNGNEVYFYTGGMRYEIVLKKKDINFWRMDIFLDENGYYVSHSTTEYFWRRFHRKKE